MTTITKAETKIRRALDGLLQRHPYFTGIIARWKVVEGNAITKTMATDGKRLIWNRSFVDTLTHDECSWVVLHEAGHCFLGHHMRLVGQGTPDQRNVAFDLALNDLIRDTTPDRMRQLGCFPGIGQFASMPRNEEAEFYFRSLAKQEQQDEQDGDQSDEQDGSEGDGDEQEQQDEQSGSEDGDDQSDASSEQEAQDGSGEGEGDEGDEDSGASEGSAQGGEEAQDGSDLSKIGQGEVGEVLEAEDDEDSGETEREWQDAVADGITAARLAGNLPGWVEQKAGAMLSAARKINWKDELRRWMQETSKAQLSFNRPNRRSAWRTDVILPTHHSRDNGKGCVLVDTSGSMSEADMNIALDEISKILSAFADAEVTMLQCDTRLIDREQKFRKTDFPLRAPQSWFGRGGTDLNPALRQIAMRRASWNWLIVITDGYWDMSAAVDTGLPTIYVITPHGCVSTAGRAKVVKVDR